MIRDAYQVYFPKDKIQHIQESQKGCCFKSLSMEKVTSGSEMTVLIPEPLELAFSRTGIGGQTRQR